MTTLTDFVRQMTPDGPEPTGELFEQVWSALRGLLVVEMKRRSNWSSPPSYLGVVGHPQWTIPGIGSDALDELAAQCFEYVFVRRLTSLRDQAETKPTVDGLVALAVGHFLLETQRRNDPLGFRVFEVLRRTMLAEVDRGRLLLVAGDERIRNDSLLARDREANVEVLREVDPSSLVERWTLDHLDGLVTASHKALSELIARLGDEIGAWLGPSRPGFRFGNLAAQLKKSVRSAWALRYTCEVSGLESAGLRALPPDAEAEAQRRFTRLAQCVDGALEHLDERRRTRLYLERLWRFLEALASDRTEVAELEPSAEGELPPHRQLARLLDIPRERIPGLLETLGTQLRTCREKMDSWTEEIPMPPPNSAPSPRDRAWASARAALAKTGEGGASSPPTGPPWVVGDVVHLPDADVSGVHWLLLAEAPGKGDFRAAPVDAFPLIGPRDVPLEELSPPEPWILRRPFELLVEARRLDRARRLHRFDPARLAELLTDPDLEGLQVVEETLPAYREWIDAGPAAAHRALLSPVLPFRSSGGVGPSSWTRWAAAALLLVALGLGVQMIRLQTAVDQLSEPILGLPYREVEFNASHRGPWRLEIPQEATHVDIGLVLVGQPDSDAYRIELLAQDRTLIYRSPELAPRNDYSLTFPVRRIDRPSLVFRLLGIRDGQTTLLDEQEIQVVHGTEP